MPSTSGPGTDSTSPSTGTKPGPDTLKRDAQAVTNEVGHLADEIKSEAAAQAEQLTGQAKEQLSQATDKVRGIASKQKDLFADQIAGVADAMLRVAGDLESSNDASAHYARMIAVNTEKLSNSIRDNSVDQLMSMAQDFGRRQPAAFVGAAALLGFTASRFLKASAQRPTAQPQPDASDDMHLPATTSDPNPSNLKAGRL